MQHNTRETTPLLSVIIPVFNGQDFLARCLDSVLNQTCSNLQILVVDDGSTDDTPTILSQYAQRDKRIVSIFQQNGGAAKARNTALAQACGKWTLFVDADDWVAHNYCETMLRYADSIHADVLISGANDAETDQCTIVCDHSQLVRACLAFDEAELSFNVDAPWGKLFRTELIKKHEILFPEKLKRSEDAFFCLRCYEVADIVAYCNRFGYCHQEREGSLCRSYAPDGMNTLELVLSTNKTEVERTHPGERDYYKSLYFRVLPGIVECERCFFLHKENRAPLLQRLIAYQKFLKRPMISEAVHNLTLADMTKKQYALRLMLYKFHLGWAFLLMKSLRP